MALLFMDTFDHYNWSNDRLKKWTWENASGWNATASSAGALAYPGGGITIQPTAGGNNVFLVKTLPSNYATGIIGGWFYFSSTMTTGDFIISFMDGASRQVSVCGDGAGRIIVARGGSGGSAGTLLATSTNTLALGVWYHIEMKATIHNTTGDYEVRVNGTSTGWIPAQGGTANTRNTANAYFNGMATPNLGSTSSRMDVKMMYVCDTSGSSANNFLGVCRGALIRPAAAGNYTQWTANSGANFWQVADHFNYHDGDLSYNATSTANNIDSFVMEDLPAGTGTVHGIQTVMIAKQDGGAARSMAPLWRISGTDYVGTTVNLGASYAMYLQQYSVSPATSSAWTVSELNGAEGGYKLIS